MHHGESDGILEMNVLRGMADDAAHRGRTREDWNATLTRFGESIYLAQSKIHPVSRKQLSRIANERNAAIALHNAALEPFNGTPTIDAISMHERLKVATLAPKDLQLLDAPSIRVRDARHTLGKMLPAILAIESLETDPDYSKVPGHGEFTATEMMLMNAQRFSQSVAPETVAYAHSGVEDVAAMFKNGQVPPPQMLARAEERMNMPLSPQQTEYVQWLGAHLRDRSEDSVPDELIFAIGIMNELRMHIAAHLEPGIIGGHWPKSPDDSETREEEAIA